MTHPTIISCRIFEYALQPLIHVTCIYVDHFRRYLIYFTNQPNSKLYCKFKLFTATYHIISYHDATKTPTNIDVLAEKVKKQPIHHTLFDPNITRGRAKNIKTTHTSMAVSNFQSSTLLICTRHCWIC